MQQAGSQASRPTCQPASEKRSPAHYVEVTQAGGCGRTGRQAAQVCGCSRSRAWVDAAVRAAPPCWVCHTDAGPTAPGPDSALAQQLAAPVQQGLQPLPLHLGADEHLTPDGVLDFGLLLLAVLHDLHGTEAAQLHFFTGVDAHGRRVAHIDDILADTLAPLPTLFLADQLLDFGNLLVNLLQGPGHRPRGVRRAARNVLDAAAHLAESEGLHSLLRMLGLRAAAHDHRSPGEAAQRRL
mmetsp:Transcript_10773/g.27740  ORF Transcript_10773/g.27740 Transcript_10773/m.27740 type:complete len:239 (-) Transcript_10773:572-1288(-)